MTVISAIPKANVNGSLTVSSVFALMVPLASSPENIKSPCIFINQLQSYYPAAIVAFIPKPPLTARISGNSSFSSMVMVKVSVSLFPFLSITFSVIV